MRVAVLVEGFGDYQAVPALITKAAALFGVQAFAPDPIRTGEWVKLRRTGELERNLDLAASRDAELILIFLDLDDGCVVDEYNSAMARVEAWKTGRSCTVEIVFASREYETMFLLVPSCLGDFRAEHLPSDPNTIRGAKECIKRLTGTRYKETQHQVEYTKRMDLGALFRESRPFRKLCRSLTGLSYEDMGQMLV